LLQCINVKLKLKFAIELQAVYLHIWDDSGGDTFCQRCRGSAPDNVKLPDNSMTVHGTPAHVKCCSYHEGVIVSGGGRNATVHDPKPK